MQTGSVRVALIFGTLACTTGCDAAEVGVLECVPPALADFELTLEPPPPATGVNSLSFHGTCTVTSVTGSPVSLALTCDDPMNPIAFSLNVGGLSDATVADAFEIGASVRLEYATIYGVFRAPAWAAIRRDGETSPSLVAVKSWQPLPWFEESAGFMSPLALEFLHETACEESQGSCNEGPRRRAAVEVSVDGGTPTVVFDRNHGNVQPYRVNVGHAEVDEGNCEGVSETWFEVVAIRDGGA